MAPERLLLPCLITLLAGSSLGCNVQHNAGFKLDLFTERAAAQAGPRINYHLDSIGGLGAPIISRHARTIPMTATSTHHHLHGAI